MLICFLNIFIIKIVRINEIETLLMLLNCLTNQNYAFLGGAFLFLSSANFAFKANFFSFLSLALANWSSVERLPFNAYFWFLKNFWHTCEIKIKIEQKFKS